MNSYQHTSLSEGNISLATLLDGLRKAVLNNTEPLWPAENGRADQEMVIAAKRSIKKNRQPVSLPLELDANEEEAFDRDFLKRFGVHPREDMDRVLNVSFKAK